MAQIMSFNRFQQSQEERVSNLKQKSGSLLTLRKWIQRPYFTTPIEFSSRKFIHFGKITRSIRRLGRVSILEANSLSPGILIPIL